MWLVWTGAVLALLRWLEIGPVARLPWIWVLSPFALAFAWFEWGERLTGRDRRGLEHDELAKRRQARAAEAFGPRARPGGAATKRR